MDSVCPPSNQTLNTTDEEFEEDYRIEVMMELVYKQIFPIFLALGILSNLINITVLCNLKKQKMKKQIQAVTTTFNYLITLAITQLMACIGLCFSIAHIHRGELIYGWAFYYAHFDTPIVNALTSASVYIVVGLSIDRFIAVCFPDYYKRVSAPIMAKFRITMALIIPILLYIPNSFSNKVVCAKSGMGYTYVENEDFDWFKFLLFEELCHRIFPAFILVVLNICIIIGFKKISKRRENMFKKPKGDANKSLTSKKDDTSARQNQEHFLLFLLISIVIAFLVTTLPATVLALIDTAGTSLFNFSGEVFRSIANILELLGFSANFLLYFCLMPDVREIIRKKLGLLTPKGHPSLSCTSSAEPNTKCTEV